MDTRTEHAQAGPDPPSATMRSLSAEPFARALIVVNPISGRGQGIFAAEELQNGLRERGVQVEILITRMKGDAFTQLRSLKERVDLVVSVGGDGTLREVFDGLVDPETAVGLLPYGTANVLAHSVGLPRDVHHALDILYRGNVQRIDAARVNGNLSFLCTGVGFDAQAVAAVERRRTGPITKWSYVRAIVGEVLRYRQPNLSVELDGKKLKGRFGFVLVANTRDYARFLKLDAQAELDDRLFEVYLFPRTGWPGLLRGLARGTLKRLPGGGVTLQRSSAIRITSEEPCPFQIDGDLGGETPVEIELMPNQYRLLVP
jgi:YegS/Rv2252/BmrU family lipid kinase